MQLISKYSSVIILGICILPVCLSLPQQHQESDQQVPTAEEPQLVTQVLVQATDCPRKSKDTDILVIHYDGFYDNGTKFDSR
jgi:FKBP-type peptidyl-prolyl cis-trans isomerase